MRKDLYIPAAIIGVNLLVMIIMIASMNGEHTPPAPDTAATGTLSSAQDSEQPQIDTAPSMAATTLERPKPVRAYNAKRQSDRPPLINMQPMSTTTKSFTKKEYKTVSGRVLTYFMLEPERPYPQDIRFPMTIVLHDSMGMAYAAEALAQDENRLRYPSFVIVPLAPEPALWASPDPADADKQNLPYVMELLEEIALAYPVDTSRIYAIGCSNGGNGTLGALSNYKDIFAAGVSISGNWSLTDAGKLKQSSLLIIHGTQDDIVPVKKAQDLARQIQKLGGHNIAYLEDPVMAHTCSTRKNYDNRIWSWLYAQHK